MATSTSLIFFLKPLMYVELLACSSDSSETYHSVSTFLGTEFFDNKIAGHQMILERENELSGWMIAQKLP